METIASKVRQFIGRFVRDQKLKDSDDIFALGYVNSMFAMQLVQFVEKEFAVTVEDADLELANFRSVDAISSFVERKQA